MAVIIRKKLERTIEHKVHHKFRSQKLFLNQVLSSLRGNEKPKEYVFTTFTREP